jgi:hypothetical protein
MDELFKSTNRFYWAFWLLAIQAIGTAIGKTGHNQSISRSRRNATSTNTEQRQEVNAKGNPLFWPWFCTPRVFNKSAFSLAKNCAEWFSSFSLVSDWRVVSLELRNKLAAFSLFEHIDLELDVPTWRSLPLPILVQKAEPFDSYHKLWATEGLGHYYADHWVTDRQSIRFLHDQGLASKVPAPSLVPLHAGIGLALAESLLAELATEGGTVAANKVRCFFEICNSEIERDYREIAYEALGLAVRNLYPHMLETIERELRQIDRTLVEYLWHGIGRAIYFSPSNFSPHRSAPWQGFKVCLEETKEAASRRNAVAGFAWALTLVNIRHPGILATFLKHHGAALGEEEAFYNGICGALAVWCWSCGQDDPFRNLREYYPLAHDKALSVLWEQMILRACTEVTEVCNTPGTFHPGMLFREIPVTRLLAQTEAQRAPCCTTGHQWDLQ